MSKIIVDSIEPRPGINTITINAVNIDSSSSFVVTGIITATGFSGSLNASQLSSGTIPDARFPSALPAIDGSSLTGIAGVPAGSMIYSFASSPPSGFLKANGATISRTTYADLFAVIGTQYGAGDGSTTFQLPDLRGEFIRGYDDGRGVDPEGPARSVGSNQSWAIQNITGSIERIAETFIQSSFTATSALYKSSNNPSSGLTPNQVDSSQSGTLAFDASRNVQTSTETRPRNVALLACIRY